MLKAAKEILIRDANMNSSSWTSRLTAYYKACNGLPRGRLEASLTWDNERREKDREQINSTDCRDPIRLNRA